VEDRLALLERLKRKHGGALQDVIDTGESLRRERELLTGAGEKTEDLQRSLADATNRFLEVARALSLRRRAAASAFARDLESLLGELAMTGTRFEVRFNARELPEDAWSERGIDEAEFFLSPNVGEDLRPLARIVSGGELSRVMLALKTMAVEKSNQVSKTLIFDEVDAGIGGSVADVVASKLRELGNGFQVLCITHLPQIAARATTQFRIEKRVRGTRTVTTVERLDETERVEEIARMIGGASLSEPVRASAREMLAGRSAAKGKQKAKGESERPRAWPRST
jgi:DNA repair protein RecN (Recombination protein N)